MPKNQLDGITINTHSEYISERSNPLKKRFFFAYHIAIQNKGNSPAKLLSRYWHITDAEGNIEEVRGPGVVGHQPRLKQGESFEYTSFCPLKTEFGVMHGKFHMVRDNGQKFDAIIKPFKLAVPFSVN
ncbi:MAG: Co2+/Mg2+ efflux protein ApaG [Candidatus Neomarinimicrobiota bacterium]|uniref:Protein ApaG n=1 Tax=marine metagenome TaxID=408172 RepID=A0A381P7Q4_9ZZZZ|nr:Co2+/Mg2+ efflux protein ApaG [Candidatus Neomarinimicrobiota bacterium]MEE3195977.1 Co2+/Mg2+ efflux protein ApaG [Candidatus Neomarinimicrobiota bacterium]|tara:strand:+ start:155 stop:538 length:384 start_codon:yes stop_codon:yes gene_type:complete